jgi:hypothetical protein
MKKFIVFIPLILLGLMVYGKEIKEKEPVKNQILPEVSLKLDTIETASYFKAFEGFGIKKSRESYQKVGQMAQLMEVEKQRPTGFFRKAYYRIYQWINISFESPQRGMSLLWPLFMVILLASFSVSIVRVFIFRPVLPDVTKPTNTVSK